MGRAKALSVSCADSSPRGRAKWALWVPGEGDEEWKEGRMQASAPAECDGMAEILRSILSLRMTEPGKSADKKHANFRTSRYAKTGTVYGG